MSQVDEAGAVILVIEDDPPTCEFFQHLLVGEGYVAESVFDGAAGLARMAAGGVDLVLLDVMMPDLDGLEVCKLLRANIRATYVPIIMVTALGGEAQRHAGFAAGGDDYVTKPFSVPDLLDRVHVWVRTRHRLRVAEEELRAAEREIAASRLEGVTLAAREVAGLLGDDLVLAVGALELLETNAAMAAPLRELLQSARASLGTAADHIQQLQRVVRVETRDTPLGPALDLERSAEA